MKKYCVFYLVIVLLLSLLAGCEMTEGISTEVILPYGSEEYESGNWSVEELVQHFEELGFYHVKTDISKTFNEDEVGVYEVRVEIDPDALLTQYKKFQKDEQVRKRCEIRIKANTLIPVLTIENCPDFAEVVKAGPDEAYEALKEFLRQHENEFIEFDGTVKMWGKPTPGSSGEYLHVYIEHGNATLYKNGVNYSELAIQNTGIGVGAKVHILGHIEDEDIVIRSLTITEPVEAVLETDPAETEPPATEPEDKEETKGYTYILNTNTGKFHYPSCSSAKKIKDSNRQEFQGTRDELIARGYSPCGNCHP